MNKTLDPHHNQLTWLYHHWIHLLLALVSQVSNLCKLKLKLAFLNQNTKLMFALFQILAFFTICLPCVILKVLNQPLNTQVGQLRWMMKFRLFNKIKHGIWYLDQLIKMLWVLNEFLELSIYQRALWIVLRPNLSYKGTLNYRVQILLIFLALLSRHPYLSRFIFGNSKSLASTST